MRSVRSFSATHPLGANIVDGGRETLVFINKRNDDFYSKYRDATQTVWLM